MRNFHFFLSPMNTWDALVPCVVMPPFILAPIYVKIPFSPFLPLGLVPCISGKITESICLLTRSPAASSCRTGIFYSELGFLSTGLFHHAASLVWPPEIFLLHRKNLLCKISLFSECVLWTCWRATSVFLPIFQNTIDDSGENDQACHVSCAVGSLPAFGVSGSS